MKKQITSTPFGDMLLCNSAPAYAQQPGKIFRIGYLDNALPAGSVVLVDALRQELGKLGWIEGKNITIEYRFAEQKQERLPELAADLVRLKVDVIVATGRVAGIGGEGSQHKHPNRGNRWFRSRRFWFGCQSGASGRQYHRTIALLRELNTKRLEVLKDAIPKLGRVGFLRSGAGEAQDLQLKELRAAALALKLKLEDIETELMPKG